MTTTVELTDRQQQVLDLLRQDVGPREIGDRLGVSRNAVYQTITRLKKIGVLPPDFKHSVQATPTAASVPAQRLLSRLTTDGDDASTEPASQTSSGVQETVSVQRREENTSLSADLLRELVTTQQELAKIANRLSRYL